jgi:hypothetical protein
MTAWEMGRVCCSFFYWYVVVYTRKCSVLVIVVEQGRNVG